MTVYRFNGALDDKATRLVRRSFRDGSWTDRLELMLGQDISSPALSFDGSEHKTEKSEEGAS